jgi:uncharacterized membrane protein YeaQ/YmgE (transglycosylase-associated protein family)
LFGLTIGKFIVLIIVGGLAGSWAGRVVTLSKEGFGRWINLGVGIAGALIGNVVFYMLHIDLGFEEVKISFEDLITAFIGSLLFVIGWWIIRTFWFKKRLVKSAV